VSTLLTFWSARLGTHLLLRLKEKFPKEDQRYEKLKASWQPNSESRFFWFFQFQALSQPVLCIPIYLAMGSLAQLSVVDFIGTLLCLMGLVGEAAADSQLKSFKASKENLGKVCDLGLWKYSRHPNYFFEWLIWCGFSCFGLSSQYWYLSPLSAAIIYVLLNYMTGIPPAEEQSLLSKGDKYRAYQAKTSRFFPWVPHK
jgi:steroid 5-alpha reductase family enzyme